MAIDPHQLDELLEVLRDHHVTEFSCPEFAVSLAPSAPAEVVDIKRDIEEAKRINKAPAVRGAFGHPSLWPNGQPPSFPKAVRVPETDAFPESDE